MQAQLADLLLFLSASTAGVALLGTAVVSVLPDPMDRVEPMSVRRVSNCEADWRQMGGRLEADGTQAGGSWKADGGQTGAVGRQMGGRWDAGGRQTGGRREAGGR